MTPLKTFAKVAEKLKLKPLCFWPQADREKVLEDVKRVALKLGTYLEKKGLDGTVVYRNIEDLSFIIGQKEFDEVLFIHQLDRLVSAYRNVEMFDQLDADITRAQKIITEYYTYEANLREKTKNMSADEMLKNDLGVLQKIGIFYVLEYTLQVLFEFSRRSMEEKCKLLKDGLKTKEYNLPAYFPLEDTFRSELCYRVYDPELRLRLLKIFYDFESVCYGRNVDKIGKALKKFNLSCLEEFKNKGLVQFKAVVYTPFGNKVSIDEVIEKVAAL